MRMFETHYVMFGSRWVLNVAGVKVYRKFYTKVKEKTHGVLGIHVVRPEPKRELTKILSGILNVSASSFLFFPFSQTFYQVLIWIVKYLSQMYTIESCLVQHLEYQKLITTLD